MYLTCLTKYPASGSVCQIRTALLSFPNRSMALIPIRGSASSSMLILMLLATTSVWHKNCKKKKTLSSVFKALSIEVNVRDLPASWLKSVRSSMTYLAGDEFSTPAMMLLKSSTLLEGGLLSKRDVLKFMSFASSCKEDYTWNSLKDVQLAQWLAYIGATTVSEAQLFLLFDEGITSPRKLVALDDEVLGTFGFNTNDLKMYVTITVSSIITSSFVLFRVMTFSVQDSSSCCK